MRTTLFAAGAALLLALSVPSAASAQRHWGGWQGSHRVFAPGIGFRRGFVGPRFGFRRGFIGPRVAFGFGAPWAFAGCSQVRHVWTPFGWRWRRIWVC
jgi:hypothetical protein